MPVSKLVDLAISVKRRAAPYLKIVVPRRLREHLNRCFDFIVGPETINLILSDLDDIPPVNLDEKYHVATMTEERESDYIKVMRQSLNKNADSYWFTKNFSDDPDYDPRNLILIYRGNEPVAAVAAWQTQYKGDRVGQIHMVGVDQKYQGRGLGRQIILLGLHRLKDRGFKKVIVGTQDYRIKVIRIYLLLGFSPLYVHRTHKSRWRKIFSEVNKYNSRALI